MRYSRCALGVFAAIAVVIPMVVAPPAYATPAAPATSSDASDLVPEDEFVWTPAEDAADNAVPEDLGIPTDGWAPSSVEDSDPPAEEEAQDASPNDGDEVGEGRGLPDEDVTANLAPAGTVAGAPGVGEMPWFGFWDMPLTQYSSAHVNLANGNVLLKATDFAIGGPGYGLRHDRFYNSLSTLPGSLGGGWQSSNGALDVGIQATSTYADFFAPNGVKLRFTRIGSTSKFTAPAGANMTLVLNSSSTTARYVLTYNQSGDQIKFASSGWLTATLDRNGVGETYAYASGKIASVVHSNGRGFTFTYDTTTGKLSTVEDSGGRNVQYFYMPAGSNAPGALQAVQYRVGTAVVDRTQYFYDPAQRLGRILRATSADGDVAVGTSIEFAYFDDASQRVAQIMVGGQATTFRYSAGQTEVIDANNHVSTYAIDSSGRVTSTTDALSRTRSQTWTANSDVQAATSALASTTPTTYTYDASNNRTGATLPTGAAASAAYATGVNCTAPNTGTAFQPKCSQDDAGNKKQYQYDAAGNLTKQTDTTTSTAVTEFEHTYGTCGGFAGQVCTSKDGKGNVTSYTYDADGNLTTVTPPSPLGSTTYAYDSLGRVTSTTDGKGDTTVYDYDARDRPMITTFDGGRGLVYSWFPDGMQRFQQETLIGVGGLKKEFTYDRWARILTQTGPRAGVTETYTYDAVGNMLTYTDSGGTMTYAYDAANQLTSVTEPSGTCPASGNPAANSGCILFEYDANALETKRILPGGATTMTTRDASGRPTRITATTGTGATAVDIGYNYVPTGSTGDRANIQSRTAYAEQGVTAGAVTSYTYDSRNRLTLAQEKSGTTTTASWAYTYDAAGNRTKQVRAGASLGTGATAGTINYGYNAANQLISTTGQVATWTYDANGNQTRSGATNTPATFGDRGEQSQLGTTSATYNGPGNSDRLSNGSLTYNSGALGLAQQTSGSTTQQYTRTPTGGLLGFKATNRWYYVQDHLGSIVGVLSSTGTFSGGYSYSPYGEARFIGSTSAVTSNPLRYIGGYSDGTGIYKLGARYYDTTLGRFTQMDPSGQESHPYTYAENNPIVYSDPSGLVAVSTLVLVAEALLLGRDVFQVLSPADASEGLQALVGLVCGTVAAIVAAPTVVGAVVAIIGCEVISAMVGEITS